MIVVAPDITGGSVVVTVVAKDCAFLANGRPVPKNGATTFKDIKTLQINYVNSIETQAICTWSNRDNVKIQSGSKFNNFVGMVSGEDADDDVPPLVLEIKGSTIITVVPESSKSMPIYHTIESSTSSYELGFSDSDYITVSRDAFGAGAYGVTFEDRPLKTLHLFGVVPTSANDNSAILIFNKSSDQYTPTTDDSPIATGCKYAEGQTVTAHSGWYARYISVKCKKTSSVSTTTTTNEIDLDPTFKPRKTAPESGNKYYLKKPGTPGSAQPDPKYPTGWNPCILGNSAAAYGRPYPNSVLPNCVGYAVGRFNEIGGYKEIRYLGSTNAENFIVYYAGKGKSLSYSNTPSQGACIVWRKGKVQNGSDGAGHVAIVEEIYKDGSILISQSGWNWKGKSGFGTEKLKASNGWRCSWMNTSYVFIGFIANPGVKYNAINTVLNNTPSGQGSSALDDFINNSQNLVNAGIEVQESASNQNYQYEKELIGKVSDIHGKQLLTIPTLVESPFIEVKIGNYTFGSYTKVGTVENNLSTARVTYPNYMESLRITKINGAVNQYVLTMNYQIQAGDDPNLIDKVFSSVSDSRKITLTYGDWNAPSFVYRNEEAIITKVTSNVDFQQSRIRYVVYCTSSSVSLKSKVYQFGAHSNTKPSKVITDLLNNNTYGLKDIFYGMKDEEGVSRLGLIPSDDKPVDIKPQLDTDIISYLNYLVSCMTSNSSQDAFIKDAAYHLIMKDETSGELSGPYFQIVKVNTKSTTITSLKAYEVNIGFPDNTLVLNFQIVNDNSWAILYNYAQSIDQEQYVYKIDNLGNMRVERSPNVMTSNVFYETTEANKSWWTQMTQFPINATLTIKGLIRPAMLMEYIKINAVFYGQKHISSGLYVITRQEDEVGKGGYKTTLSLTRIAGDEDDLYNIKQTTVVSGNSQQAVNTSTFGAAAGLAAGVNALAGTVVNGLVVGANGLSNNQNDPVTQTNWDIPSSPGIIFNEPTQILVDDSVEVDTGFTGGQIGGGGTSGLVGSGRQHGSNP